MHKVSRTLLLAGVLAFGGLTAACDDNNVTPLPATGVQSVTLTPPSATIPAGTSIQLAVSVVADASTAKTVTYTTSSAAVATVDATGKVTGVAAGTATIIATSTADASKAAASVITVTGVVGPTGNTVAISTVNQNGPGGSQPANLAAVAGQLDVTLFVTGPAAQLDLIMNCNNAGDVVVASQVTNGTQQNQSSVTLSFNTAATGTVTGGVAVPSATSTTPIFLNGNCILKAKYGTATAQNVVPLTLVNASFFRTAISTSGPSAISGLNGFNYQSGDLVATITPVNYVSATPLSFISGTFAGRTFTNVAPATGTQTFNVTFPGGIVAAGTTPPALSIANYTSPAAGDNLQITASVTTSGQTGFVGTVPTAGPIRVDNGAPNAPTTAVINSATSWINGAYTFTGTGKYVSGGDQGAPATGTNTNVTVVQYALSTAPSLAGNANYGVPAGSGIGPTQCSQTLTGWTTVTSSAAIPKSAAGSPTQYRARVIETDKIGNVSCTDLAGIAGSPNGPLPGLATGFFSVDPDAPFLAQTGGPTGGSPTASRAQNAAQGRILTGAQDNFNPTDSISGFVPARQVNYTLYRNFSAVTANCVPINDLSNPVFTGGTTANGCSNSANNAPSIIIDGNTGVEAYYNLIAKSVDQAGNFSTPLTYVYLLDNTAPVVQGISIPQNLTGGVAQTFTSTATDNVDLQASNFNITYSAATGLNLFYAGDNYGPNYDATIVTSAAVNATVPFFIKQLQATAASAPAPFTAADSGEAQTVAVRAIDAANQVSVASTAAIPNINISSSAGFSTTDLSTFNETNGPVNISNGTGTNPTTVSLTAAAVLTGVGGSAQSAPIPFSQVCFYYQQTAAAFAIDPTIPTGTYVQIGCVGAPIITDALGANPPRTWTYTLAGFDPPAALGTASTVSIIAIGIKSTGVGLASAANTAVTLVP